MKTLTHLPLFGLLLVTINAQAQFGQRVDGPVNWAGLTLHENDTLRFGQGTLANGTFRFLFANNGNRIDGSNYNLVIKKFEVRRVNDGQIINYVIMRWPFGMVNVHVSDLAGAINSGELTAVNGLPLQSTHAPKLIADELLKLKQLLDSGALTQQEFNDQKAKLLKQ